MSNPVISFITRVSQDQAFRDRILKADEPAEVEAIVQDAGYSLTDADFIAFAQQAKAQCEDGALSEEALAGVAGGGAKEAFRAIFGVVNSIFVSEGDAALPYVNTTKATDTVSDGLSGAIKGIAGLFN